jgi:hypothetical protein
MKHGVCGKWTERILALPKTEYTNYAATVAKKWVATTQQLCVRYDCEAHSARIAYTERIVMASRRNGTRCSSA